MITYCPRCGARHREETSVAWGVTPTFQCVDCGMAVADPPAMLAKGNDEEEVEYDLSDWEPAERSMATNALLEADIPYRWEADLVLAVPAVAEAEVDQLLDDLEATDADLSEAADDDEGAEEGGEEAHAAMVDLFVGADRLQHDPLDGDVAADVMYAAGTVSVSSAPYGIERPVWRRIQDLASAVVTDLEEAVDEDTVAADARALREYLRDLV